MAEGHKAFAAEEILTAADVNDYLMQQACMVFADSSARTSALSGVLREGMISYLKDVNQFEVRHNSSWERMGTFAEFDAEVGGDALTALYMEVL